MKNIVLKILTVVVFYLFSFGQAVAITPHGKKGLLPNEGSCSINDGTPLNNTKTSTLVNLEIPKTNPGEIIVKHIGYSLLYNETHEQASWVAYELTKEESHKIYERSDKFIPDPEVKTGTANDSDYAGSGYDRGHIAPAADMSWSDTAMDESFYYSNMSPQEPSFNRGVWKKLEELVRTWAVENNSVYIVSGPVLTESLPAIGPHKVSVPKYYYKVILDYTEPIIKGIGFIIPNSGSNEQLQQFAVSIDSVEKFTGLDFFPLLLDQQEDLIEKTVCVSSWSWENTKTKSKVKAENKETKTGQCKGITKSGARCKNKASNNTGYCHHHIGQKHK